MVETPALQDVWAVPLLSRVLVLDSQEALVMTLTLGIDLACRTAHVASLAGADGVLVWSGRTFFTRPGDLQRLWDDVGCDPSELTVVIEPTRDAWVPVDVASRPRSGAVRGSVPQHVRGMSGRDPPR